eukprot:scaffold13182_cov64-Attheya_sp.AAC.1
MELASTLSADTRSQAGCARHLMIVSEKARAGWLDRDTRDDIGVMVKNILFLKNTRPIFKLVRKYGNDGLSKSYQLITNPLSMNE